MTDAEIVQFPPRERMPLRFRKRTISKRLRRIGNLLNVPYYEVAAACADEIELVEFAARYGQSLDWIVLGDPDCMIRTLGRERRAR